MMNQHKSICFVVLLATLTCFGIGCGGEEEKVSAPVVKTAPKTQPKPKAKSVDQLMDSLSIDARIQLDENEAPRSESQRIAVLNFFNAMLRADEGALKTMLSYGDQLELDAMINAGLESSMEDVSLVILKTGESSEGEKCIMAIYETGMEYQIQLWFIEESGNGVTFSAVDTQPNLVDKLSGNWIESFFELKSKQAEIAQQPDEETSYTLAGDMTSTSGNQGSGNKPSGPSGPSSPGGPRPPGR